MPPGWTDTDIGGGPTGSARVSNGVFDLTSCGATLYNPVDQFNMAWQSVTGDQTLIARLTGLVSGSGVSKAGLMFRASTAADALFAIIAVKPNGAIGYYTRDSVGAQPTWHAGNARWSYPNADAVIPSANTPIWLKLVKSGHRISAFFAASTTEPSAWTQLGPNYHVDFGGGFCLAGLALSSGSNQVIMQATFDNVSVGAPADK